MAPENPSCLSMLNDDARQQWTLRPKKPVYLYSIRGAISPPRTDTFNWRLAMEARVRRPGHPMPEMAAFMAKLRSAFGDETVDEAVRRGKAGEPTFYACENGNSVAHAICASTKPPISSNRVKSRSRSKSNLLERCLSDICAPWTNLPATR